MLPLLCVTFNLFADGDSNRRENTQAFYNGGLEPVANIGVNFLDALFRGKPETAYRLMRLNENFPLQGLGTVEDIEKLELSEYHMLTYELKAYKQLSSESGMFFFTAHTKHHGPLFIKLGYYYTDNHLYLSYFDLGNDYNDAIKTLNQYDELEYPITLTPN